MTSEYLELPHRTESEARAQLRNGHDMSQAARCELLAAAYTPDGHPHDPFPEPALPPRDRLSEGLAIACIILAAALFGMLLGYWLP